MQSNTKHSVLKGKGVQIQRVREYPVHIRKYRHKITLHYRLKYSVAKAEGQEI